MSEVQIWCTSWLSACTMCSGRDACVLSRPVSHCRDGEESREYLISCYEAYTDHHSDGYEPSTAANDVKLVRASFSNGESFRCSVGAFAGCAASTLL